MRMLWCGVLITKPWMQSTSPPLDGSINAGSSQERFSSRISLVREGKNSSARKSVQRSCSMTGCMVMSLSAIVIVVLPFFYTLPLRRRIAVNRIDPQHGFRFFHRLNVEIDGDGLAVAAHQ